MYRALVVSGCAMCPSYGVCCVTSSARVPASQERRPSPRIDWWDLKCFNAVADEVNVVCNHEIHLSRCHTEGVVSIPFAPWGIITRFR